MICQDIDINFKEGERMLKQMEVEINTSSNIEKKEQMKIFLSYKQNLESLKRQFFISKEEYTYSKKMNEMVLQTGEKIKSTSEEQSHNSSVNDQKVLLVANDAIIAEKSSNKLQMIKQISQEIEQNGQMISIEMNKNNMKLQNAIGKVEDLNSLVDRSSSIIKKIMTREHRNKFLVAMFSLTFVSLFLLILYSRS